MSKRFSELPLMERLATDDEDKTVNESFTVNGTKAILTNRACALVLA